MAAIISISHVKTWYARKKTAATWRELLFVGILLERRTASYLAPTS